MKCDCPDWEPNTKIINGMIATQANMAWGHKEGFTGKKFEFCPWCGKKLKDERD